YTLSLHDALPILRIAETRRRIEADVLKRLDDARLALFVRQRLLMHGQAFGDDIADRHARAQRAERILKHDLHVAAERQHVLEAQALDVATEEHDRSVRGNQPE